MTGKIPIFSGILAATGRLDAVDPPTVTAARLARRENARLNVVHVVTSARITGDIRWPPRKDRSGRPAAIPSFPMMARRLVTLYADESPGLTSADVRIAAGVAWEAIFKSATELGSHLIVLGPHSEPSITTCLPKAKGLLGSTADGVIRHANCPVMIINRTFATRRLQFKNIVIGIDFSRACISALCLAALLATYFSSRLHPFHMLPIPPYPKYTPESYKVDRRRIEGQLTTLCRQLLNGSAYQIRIMSGTIPHTALLQHARDTAADLIVIGSHTKEKAGKWYPGSVAQQLSFQAHCPLLVVNGPDALIHWKDDPRVTALAFIEIPPLTLFPP